MSLSDSEVRKIAKLANLNLTDQQVEKFTHELNGVFSYVENLNKIDVSAVEPTSHVHGSTNFFREDINVNPMPVEDGLRNTPDRSANYIRVPIIIDQSVEN